MHANRWMRGLKNTTLLSMPNVPLFEQQKTKDCSCCEQCTERIHNGKHIEQHHYWATDLDNLLDL